MLQSFSEYKELQYEVGNADVLDNMEHVRPMSPFSDDTVLFLNDLSNLLMRTGKEYSDVITFGFWCRKAALLKERERYDDLENRVGRGIVFHIAPSNVPVNFAFSFAAGLLAGNANIVRIPTKDYEQVRIICEAVKQLLSERHVHMIPYVCMVRYPADSSLTSVFSSFCDSRIIWGGDDAISQIRKSPLKPRANELTFADRFSIALIHADAYLSSENKFQVAQEFYNDTYYSDQNACTSPRIVIWTGKHLADAKEMFWDHLHSLLKDKYLLRPTQSVGKLAAAYFVAANRNVKIIPSIDQYLTRIKVTELDSSLLDYMYNSGFFFEYDVDSISEIFPLCTQRFQTLVYYGFEPNEIRAFMSRYRPSGIDRVVPIGKSMDFSLIWDGYDLIRELSRRRMII